MEDEIKYDSPQEAGIEIQKDIINYLNKEMTRIIKYVKK